MRYALLMARTLGAELEVVHVWSLPALASSSDVLMGFPDQPYQTATEWIAREAQVALGRFIAAFDLSGVRVGTRLESGRAEDTIVAIVREEGFDLIVMGTHGRSGLSHFLMGSVAERVVRLSPCPVLTVKTEPAGGADEVSTAG